MVRPSPDPTFSIYTFLAYYLRFMRLKHGATQAEVGKIINCSNGQVSKYESGEKRLDGRQCAALDEVWATGGLFKIMLGFAKLGVDARGRERLAYYQQGAVEHHIFSSFVPIPLQTEEYARELLLAGYCAGVVADLEKAVAQRMELQRSILSGDPDLWIVIDQVALRVMHRPSIMKAQWCKIIAMSNLPNISVRVLPLETPPHTGLDGSHWFFTMPDRRVAAFSGNSVRVGAIIEDQTEAFSVSKRFQRIAARAWNEDQSCAFIADLVKKLGNMDPLVPSPAEPPTNAKPITETEKAR